MEKTDSAKETKKETKEDVKNEITNLPTTKSSHSKHHYSSFMGEENNDVTEKKAL